MRTTHHLLLAAFFLVGAARAADEALVPVQKLVTGVNTAGSKPEISFNLLLDAPLDASRSSELWENENLSDISDLRDAASQEIVAQLTLVALDKLIRFKVSDPKADLARRISNREILTYIHLSTDLPVIMQDGTRTKLTPAMVRELSAQISLSEARLAALEDVAHGRQRIYEDQLDLTREVGEADSLTAQYVLSYQLSQNIARTPLVIEATGRLSTDEDNPLNRLDFSLLGRTGVNRFDLGTPMFYSAYLSGSVFGTQTFENAAASIELGADVLFPNVVDLTGGANRLRLKPVVGVSLGYRRQFDDQELFDGEQNLFEIGYEAAYLIPVLEKYTLSFDSEGTYNEKAKGEAFFHTTSLALYYDLPPDDLKVLAKWEVGRNEFSYDQDNMVLLGVIADFLPF